MRQVAQNYKTGELSLLEVPVPACRPGGVLVRTEYSLISAGTEKMKVDESKMSLPSKAKARPDQVRKVVESVAQQGLRSTYRKVMNRLDSYTPLGYSLVGVVEEVGTGVSDLGVGQRVACAGDKHALHAELNWVPRNLCVPVPDEVDVVHAAFTTVGAIAMQGFRQSEAHLGEAACVIGLGLIGQILVRILHSAGLYVIGIDLVDERCRLAEAGGAAAAGAPEGETFDRLVADLMAFTEDAGADHVFLAASTKSRDPVLLAARLARDRARIVDIGKSNLDLPWKEFYEKELDVRFSRSYGPGRYDPRYEEEGIDYPIGYVRWTERRNMKGFLDLLAAGRVDLAPLVSEVHPFDAAVEVYERLHEGQLNGVGVLFRYDTAPSHRTAASSVEAPPRAPSGRMSKDLVHLGVIGAGNYATTMLLPHLDKRGDVELMWVATDTALSAATAQRRFGFRAVTTDYRDILADGAIDAVLIATRHDAHASIAAEALHAGKATFVEKPLAIDAEGLESVLTAVGESGNDRLLVGFNRRFAPLLRGLKQSWGSRREPVVVRYAVNAGPLAADSWYRDTARHGTRFIGEGCHFVDTVSWWLDCDPVEVFAAATLDDADNLVCTLRYPDGSVATIDYLTKAARNYPKEIITVSGEGKLAKLHNFTRVELWSGGRRRFRRTLKGVDKGQKGELDAFINAVRYGAAMPIPFSSLVATTETTFAAHRSLSSGKPEPVAARREAS